ncbi:MAG: PorV/PorQ family protein [Candidatus Kapabacteria bacterium]|nr:PorV/PorQ family protein [Candidatus Kapabacteria bacterium]MDW8011979.1 PorV/PorQ family protein [Bacteroidota bacterium]
MDSVWPISSYSPVKPLFGLLIASAGWAQPLTEGVALSSLQRPAGARALGLAGVYTAIANEPSGCFANPAASAWLSERPQAAISVSLLGIGRVYSSLAYAQSISQIVGVSAGLRSFSGGSFTARTSRGEPLGSYVPQDYALALGGAFRWDFFSVGVLGKYLWSGLLGGGIAGNGFAADLGALFQVSNAVSIGAALSNLGGFIAWQGHRESLPLSIAVGVATELQLAPSTRRERHPITGEETVVWIPSPQYLLISTEARYTQGIARPSLLVAVEVAPLSGFSLRTGLTIVGDDAGRVRWFALSQLGGGIGIQMPPLTRPTLPPPAGLRPVVRLQQSLALDAQH